MAAHLPLLPLFPASHKLAVELAPRRERQPGTCKRCKLSFNSGNPCLPVDGKVGGLLIVSDYPGEQEDKNGIPFCGASGQFLRNHIKAMWGSDPVAYTNALNCRVSPNSTMTQLAVPIKKCRDYLRDTLEEVKPTRVIAMGAVAIYSITGRMLPPMSVRRGYTWLSDGTPVFYMTNPAHACRNYFLKSRFETDLRWALFTNPRRRNGVYIVIRSLEEAAYAEKRLMDNPRWHTFDCETKGRMFDAGFGVTTVSICKGGDDYVFVWDEVSLANPKLCASMKRVLESEVGKGGFNVKYDINAVWADPDLRIEIPNVVADLMLWRHQSDSNIKDNTLNVCTEILGLGGAKEEGHTAVDKMVKAMKKSAKKSLDFKDQLQFGETRDKIQEEFEAVYPDVRAQAFAYAKIDQATRNKYNCLMAGTPVVLADGSTETIEKIVRGKKKVDVLSWDPVHGICSARVVGWHRQRVDSQKWLCVQTAKKLGNRWGESRQLVLTPDHKVLTQRGWIAAECLRLSDEVALPETAWTELQRQAAMGTVLGDTRLVVSPTYRDSPFEHPAALDGGHTDETGFAQYKTAFLHPHVTLGPIKSTGFEGKPFRTFWSKQLMQLRSWWQLFYDADGTRRLRTTVLDQCGDIGLAWWFMDDGCRQKRYETVCISVQRYPREDQEAAREWLTREFGKVYLATAGVLRFSVPATIEFCRRVAEYMPEQMRYKLPPRESWPKFRAPLEQARQPWFERVVSIFPYTPPRADKGQRMLADTRWCLTVKGTENFFTSFGLVHNCRDTFSTDQGILAFQDVMAKSDHMRWMWEEIYRPAIRGMAILERTGMAVDKNAVIALALALDQALGELKYQLSVFGKFDPDSPASLGRFLFGPRSMGGLELTSPMNKKGKSGSTEAYVLDLLRGKHPVIPVIEEYRKLATLQKRYARGMLPYICEDGRVHSSFLLEGTDTARLSSRDPNMQNIPAKMDDKWAVMVRNCFVARPGYTLVAFDYSQHELRIAALLSQDPKFIEVVNSGQDIHRGTAALVYDKTFEDVTDDERTYTKRTVFGLLFGMRAYKLYMDMKLASVQHAQALIDKIFGQYVRLHEWLEGNVAYARKNGCIWVIWKGKPAYRRYVFDILSSDKDAKDHAERVCYNTPVQGSAVLHMNRGIFDVAEWISETKFPAFMVNTVHDALYLEVRDDCVPESLVEIPKILKRHENPQVPLVVDAKVGPRLGMLEKAKKPA